MTCKIRVLKVDFDKELPNYQIPGFRGAIIAKAGRESGFFHNHTETGFVYRYPLIQYKTIGRKVSIVCVEEGVDEMFKLFTSPDWNIQLGQEQISLNIERLNVNQFNMQVWDHNFQYRITNWLALNQDNYHNFIKLESLGSKIEFLEGLLKANILAFAKGVDWFIDKEVKVSITKMDEPFARSFKRQKLMAFNVEFSTNAFLPSFIGLGKGVSHGFGIVFQNKQK